ncbi:acetyl-CoA hydrolase/transferase family protein [Bacillus badius]|uniref:4-hydroxybutyrate:acetyl-CoA CoA transferase n=1 Tax=Bacillus badius TaxID=1455 RepID=A0ABR5AW90_BACBA|nr:acetyl-CoA hydrolase/transferase C-terminal domain-containing protein [Bacillus badius]KIL78989.1 4-hydroxybutyrate:acetyl-CoA CoA transferase [Bacillus badius]MED4715572.1 acetyl-CoA hydrolase/transferase C-terminal domain-containing protein [Bacillus badius]
MTNEEQYRKKWTTAEEAVRLIEEGDDIIVPLIAGEPPALLAALEQREDLKRNRLFQMLTSRPAIRKKQEELKVISMFLSGGDRQAFREGAVDLLPNHFSDVPELLKETTDQRVIMATVSPMDENGFFSLGTNCDYTASLAKEAKTILLEVNEYMPRTYGMNQIHLSEVTALIEQHQPLIEAPVPVITEKDETIGRYVASLIHDGDSLQIGFGAIPNAVMNSLKNHQNLSIVTEMIPDQLVELYQSGAVTNSSRIDYPGKTTATFAYGTKKLYDFLHENKTIYMLPVSETNDVRRISGIRNMVTINATIEVDFLGQCNSEKVGDVYWSSSGGQADFGMSARMSQGGRGIICLHSTAKNDTISKIVPVLAAGTPVTTSKNDVDYIVTEYGIAQLRGKTVRERVQALIQVAHPKFQEELTDQARNRGYLM